MSVRMSRCMNWKDYCKRQFPFSICSNCSWDAIKEYSPFVCVPYPGVAQRVHSKGDKSKVQKDQYWPSLGDFRNTSYNKTCLLYQKKTTTWFESRDGFAVKTKYSKQSTTQSISKVMWVNNHTVGERIWYSPHLKSLNRGRNVQVKPPSLSTAD